MMGDDFAGETPKERAIRRAIAAKKRREKQ
jgi:hypothetical protein